MSSEALEIRETLGLSADASDKAVLAAIRALKDAGQAGWRAAAVPDVIRQAFGDGAHVDIGTTPL